MDRTGQYLLHFPVMEAGVVVLGPLTAIAKCKEGTAAWSAFQSSQTLSSRELADRCLHQPGLPAAATCAGTFCLSERFHMRTPSCVPATLNWC